MPHPTDPLPAPTDRRAVLQAALADLADVSAVSRWVRSGDVRLHVLDYGGDGVPTLLLPGISSPAMTMDFVARALPPTVRPIVVDMRGRGLSDSGDPASPAAYSLEAYAADVVAVVGGLGLDRPLVVGHSMGGRVAALTAARGEVELRGTVVVDPPMSGPDRGPYPVPASMLLGQLAEARAGVTAEHVAAQWPAWPAREAGIRARWLSSCATEALAGTHRGFETEDFFAFWPAVPAPTVLIYGGDSPMVTAAGAAEAAAANPGARMLRVPDAGHMVFWDNPAAAVPLLAEVLGDLARARVS